MGAVLFALTQDVIGPMYVPNLPRESPQRNFVTFGRPQT